MEKATIFENYPVRIVLLSAGFTLAIYALGVIILAHLAIWLSALYVVFCFALEYRLLRSACTHCYYYGKVCGFGKGKLCSLFFKQGDPRRFAARSISWAEILPDFLVFIIPLVVGIAVLIDNFDWLLVLALVILAALSFGGNAFIRGSVTCKHCQQREVGCPAEKLFRHADEAQQP